jgi:hypothetical protein
MNPKFRKPTGLTKQVIRSPEPRIDLRVGKMVFGTEKALKFASMIANPLKECSPAVGLFLFQYFLVPVSLTTTMFFYVFYRR